MNQYGYNLTLLPSEMDKQLVSVLDKARHSVHADIVIVVSATKESEEAALVNSDSSVFVRGGEKIVLPSVAIQTLSVPQVSKPVRGDEFTWPATLERCQRNNVIIAPIFDLHNHLIGAVLFAIEHPTLNAMEENFAELARQRVELTLQKKLVENPYADQLNEKVALLDEISALSKTGGWEYDVESDALSWTAQTYRLLGVTETRDAQPSFNLANISKDSRRTVQGAIQQAIATQTGFTCDIPFLSVEGKTRWASVTGKVVRNVLTGKVQRVYGAVRDVTEEKHLSDTEFKYAEYLSTILDNLHDAVVTIDTQGTIITANKPVKTLFGYHPGELLGMDVTVLMPEPYASEHADYMNAFLKTGKANIIGVGRELTGLHRSGREFPIDLCLSETLVEGERRFVGIIRDITERKRSSDHIYRLAYFDDVTGLPNMKSFEQALAKLIRQSREKGQDIYCCMLDLDNFSQFNLSFGKSTGDYILRVLAGRISRTLSASFKVFRGTADEFLILYTLPVKFDDESVANTLDDMEWQLHENVLCEISLHGNPQQISGALSTAQVLSATASYEKLIGILEFGKRRAKSQGHGGRVCFERDAFAEYERHNEISRSLISALTNNEFFLMLQPQFDASGSMISAEALLRWTHPTLGDISPGEFIPVAEESDAIVDIGYWVINEACRLLNDCQAQGVHTKIAVNISGRHIARADFRHRLLKTVENWQVSPHQLVIEITETTLVKGIDLVRRRIDELSRFGFEFSIDDFGTGYSSLSYLKELPIAELKIDRYFVDEISFSSVDVPIVNTILDMAQALGVRTVAEGIENQIQMDYLVQRGCNVLQGFYLGRPVHIEHWRSMLTNTFATH
ncbi:hypothetical protein GCM10007391_05030 [Alteromonas halophila]|uniref:Sensor protein FixL n=2 Tax=Alteromonas halophila TaxID=516698 RepID=A0A918MV83_9ALTE|nr:hypothetical protein GCM10007391_05030 [Alteromonas halophila]